MVIAALLALVVMVVWSPDNPGSLSPEGDLMQSQHHSHDAAQSRNNPQGVLHAGPYADCDASGIGCCVMTHCHPGIASDLHDMTVFVADEETTPAAAVLSFGRGPAVVLPPPRRLPV